MTDWLGLACLIVAIGLLYRLSVIDLRVRLLPDRYVLSFAISGFLFHIFTGFAYGNTLGMAAGAALGAGILYGIRLVANHIYKQDALGLGDVKLMGAAGIWLSDWVLMALCVGSLCGMVHGLAAGLIESRRTGQKLDLNRLEVPAGPGFALGIVVIGGYIFREFFQGLF